MSTGFNGCDIAKWIKGLGVCLGCVFLASCGAIQSKNIEEMNDNERLGLLLSKSDAELCGAYNHPLLKTNTEQQIEKILRDRKIGRCDARSKVRAIPLILASVESIGDVKKDVAEINEAPVEKVKSFTAAQSPHVSTQIEKQREQTAEVIFGDKNALLADIEAMKAEKLNKGDFESNYEYEQRKKAYFEKFKNSKSYRIIIDIENPQNKIEKLVYFDPDAEELRIALPPIYPNLVRINSGGKDGYKWLHNSFVQVDSTGQKPRVYKASNRLGASIKVVELDITRYGIAVLSQATKNYYSKDLRQRFSTHFSRGDAKEILEKGKIVMEVVLDPRYPLAGETPFLIKTEDETKPTFDRPFDITETRYAVPVRLLNIRLLNNAGKEVFATSGRQVDVEPLTD